MKSQGFAGTSALRGALLLGVWLAGCGSPLEGGAPTTRPDASPFGQPDAGEGARAKREEGKIGKREAKIERQIAENSGLLGATGSGEGGGGAAVGLGGLGTKGMGSGASGFGQAGGNFGAAPEVANTEQFTHHGVNGFAITETDRVSTFSVDVDTASYSIVRRKLREGALPPEAAVRAEELVNALDYRYTPPARGDLFAVHSEVAPHPLASGRHLLRVGVKGEELPTANRPPVHLTFLVDVSGSMSSPDKLPLAQQALHYLVDNLGAEDTVAIATYAGGQSRALEPTPTTRAAAIHDAIDSLRSSGGTAMESGMVLAYDMAQQSYLPGAENRVIVLSDGDANIGRTGHTEVLESISRHAGQGITMSTIGFGMGNYKDTLMEQLADKGDGNYFYVDSLDEAKKIFGTNLAGTIRTIARDVKIQVDLDPAYVHSYRLIGYENRDIADKDFRNDAVDAGEVGSGHQVTALYELILTDKIDGPIGAVRIRAKPPGKDAAAKEWSTPITRSTAPSFDSAGRDMRLAFGVASLAEILRGSPYAAETSYDDVLRIVRGASDLEDASHKELIEMIERAKELSGSQVAARVR